MMSRTLHSVGGLLTFAYLLTTQTVQAAAESAYFSSVEPIKWIDCTQNVPAAFAEANSLSSTVWPKSATPLPKSLNCGRLDVPVDYDKPFGSDNTLTIAFTLVKADNPQGLLIYNPGGPAAEAQSTGWGAAFEDMLGNQEMFTGLIGKQDLLFYDTRGIGDSNRITCDFDLSQTAPDSWFTTPEEFDEIKAYNQKFAQTCIDQTTPKGLIEKIGTDSVIRDWNSIRIALKYDKVNYLGISYGTWYGAELAYDFQENQGRFVLDGVAAHGQPDVVQVTTDLNAMNRLLLRADAWCIANSTCPYNKQGKGTVPSVFKAQVKSSPQEFTQVLRGKFRQLMTGNPQFAAFNDYLYTFEQASKDNFKGFQGRRLAKRDGEALSTDLDQMSFQAVVCKDENVDDPTFEGFQAIMKNTTGDDPDDLVYTSFNWQIKLGCVGWPVPGRPKFTLPNSNPSMWVTSDFDLNTPTEQATTAWQDTPNSVLVDRHGDNHGTATLIDQPARGAELAFLVNGVLPAAVDQELVDIITPGQTRPPIDDPYEVPVGLKAGDVDSVNSDVSSSSSDDEPAGKSYASQNLLESGKDTSTSGSNDGGKDDNKWKMMAIGLGAAAAALLLLWLATLIAFFLQRRRIPKGGSPPSAFLASSSPRVISGKDYAFNRGGAAISSSDANEKGAYDKVATKGDFEDEQEEILAGHHH